MGNLICKVSRITVTVMEDHQVVPERIYGEFARRRRFGEYLHYKVDMLLAVMFVME